MTNHTKNLDAAIQSLRKAYTPEQWEMLGGDEPAPRPDMAYVLEEMNAAQIRLDRATSRCVLAVVCFVFGLALAALAFSHAYNRAVDSINNPHIEGF